MRLRDDAPEVWIWGITASGERVVIVDRSLVAYFYAVVEETANPETVVEAINQSDIFRAFRSLSLLIESSLGKPVKAVKVYCKTPEVCQNTPRHFESSKASKTVSNMTFDLPCDTS